MSDVLYYCRQIPAAMLPLRVYGLHGVLQRAIHLPAVQHAQEKGCNLQKEFTGKTSIKARREFARRSVNRA